MYRSQRSACLEGVVRRYTALRWSSAACARVCPLSAVGMGWNWERVNKEALQNVEASLACSDDRYSWQAAEKYTRSIAPAGAI